MSETLKPRMSPNIPGKLKWGRTFLIGFAFFSSQVAWAYYNAIMPLVLRDYMEFLAVSEDAIDVLVGVVMVLDNVIAIFLLPVFGSLSDRTRSKFGKRTPYILIGATCGAILFSVIGTISNTLSATAFWGMVSIIMLFNLSMAFYRSPAVSLMPDLTDPKARSKGNAIINLMGALAMVFGLVIPTVSKSLFGEAFARTGGFYIVSFLSLVGVLILGLTIKETPTGSKFMALGKKPIALDPVTLENLGEREAETKEPLLESLRNVFVNKDRNALLMLLVIFTWFFGYNAINTFYTTYATEYLLWTEDVASGALAIAPITMIISAVLAGWIGDKFGRKPTIFVGIAGLSLSTLAIYLINDPSYLIIVFGVIGVFYGLININTIVMVWQISPKDKIGSYTGVYYFFSQFSDVLSPLAIGGLFSLYKAIFNVPQGDQYVILFPYVIICEIAAMVILAFVKENRNKSE